MKPLTMLICVGAAGIGILGAMMSKTNPNQVEYEKYAVQKLTTYLKTDVCQKTPSFLERLIKTNCEQVLESATPHIKELITSTTKRQDYMIFSIYRTEIKLDSWIPGYKFETVGALNQFYTYNAQEK
ncbi:MULTISPECIES: DUF4359 domain-containing protein [unclassified Anabaena]|uniref:DUF4359 domain-containing protein n=1 Tax=unclassified Anabaena TaxID=2619674 RepID=UPI001447B13E|nr:MULTISPECIES: DUF4359 domain-containing protein [unclassified Anabaena]MTJ07160.1 DUF4359 domain-containing protein [Anabaena sp. UHCC 0204]MTJ55290.1 DUF4359 domain-containing protein [Anabaena sp. UHCC 0253]